MIYDLAISLKVLRRQYTQRFDKFNSVGKKSGKRSEVQNNAEKLIFKQIVTTVLCLKFKIFKNVITYIFNFQYTVKQQL